MVFQDTVVIRASLDERAVAVVTGATGLEPATSGVTGRRSNQLNYAPGRAWPGAAMSMPQQAPRGSQPGSRPRTITCGWRATYVVGRTGRFSLAVVPRPPSVS